MLVKRLLVTQSCLVIQRSNIVINLLCVCGAKRETRQC